MKRVLISLLTMIFLLTNSIYIFAANEKNTTSLSTDDSPRVVRVGWYDSEGVHTIDKNGNLGGFDYEYLQALSQYANWEFEFVPGTWSECYEWLKNGEIDLLNIVNKTPEREEIFDFCATSSGNEYCCLYVDSKNTKYSYHDFEHFDGMTVAVENGTHQSALLANFAETNNFTYSVKVYPTLSKCQEALSKGEVDALLSSNTDIIQGNKAIAQFNPISFYFATTKGNTEFLKELDNAINMLQIYNPNFNNYIYTKYYSANTSTDVVFTEKELAFIKSNPKIQVLIDPIWFPIESFNYGTHKFEGIIPDLLKKISEQSGLEFTLINGDSSVSVLKEFRDTSANIITSISYDYDWANANHVNITQPFLDASVMCVTKQNHSEPNTVALVELDYLSENVYKYFPHLEPIYYESIAKCIEAVYNGEADCTYMNNYEAEYFMSHDRYQGLSYTTTPLFRQKLCLGVSKDADPELYSIISKCLNIIPDNEIEALIYENSYSANQHITFKAFVEANPLFMVLLIAFFATVILISFIVYIRAERKNNIKIAIQNERYEQLATMINEHLYEYSFADDVLSFSNAPEEFFGGLSVIRNYSKIVQNRTENKGESLEDTLWSCFMTKEDNIKEIFFTFPNHEPRWYKVTTKIIKDENGKAKIAMGKLQDIQNEHDEKESLIDLAKRDGLTGLYNAKAFPNIAKENLSRDAALVILDVDKFKNINDIYGHYNGDIVLISIADKLREVFRNHGVIGRLGGDEFAVFLPKCVDDQLLSEMAQDLLNRAATITIEKDTPITLSIGIAHFSENDTYDDLYIRADKALYDVKNSGRNNFKILKNS